MDEVNADREAHGKNPFADDDTPPTPPKKKRDNTSKKKLKERKKEEKKRTITKSTTDPDCGLFVKGEHKKHLAYEAHTAERVFADAKEQHGMRYTRYAGLAQVKNWVKLKFAAMNLKKFAKWNWRDTHFHSISGIVVFHFPISIRNPGLA